MKLYRHLVEASEEDRETVLERVREWTSPATNGPPSAQVLTANELAELARSPLMDVGSHTLSHPVLASLPRGEQEREVSQSRVFLQELLEQEVSLFSYPNGSWSPLTESVVRNAGFTAACGSQNDAVLAHTNRYRLPRFWPSDSPTALSRPLRVWLGR